MQTDTVSRYEKKYILNEYKFERLYEAAAANLTADTLNASGCTYTICDLYYKITDSKPQSILTLPSPKTNICIRSYGVPTLNSNVYLEIKDNDNGKITKTRTRLPLHSAYDALTGDFDAPDDNEVLKRIQEIRQQGKIVPELFIAYDRYAFSGCKEQDLRMTFDINIRSRDTDLALEQGDFAQQILPNRSCLMEIKTNRAYPLWLTAALAKCNMFCGSKKTYAPTNG